MNIVLLNALSADSIVAYILDEIEVAYHIAFPHMATVSK